MAGNLNKLAAFVAVILLAAFAYFLYDTFRERTPAEKLAAIYHQADRRTMSETLTGYLNDESVVIRSQAALAIGRIGDPTGLGLLMDLIREDSSIEVASKAAFAIGISGEKQFADNVLDLALDQPSAVTAHMVTAAGRLADSSMNDVHDALVGFLTHPSPRVREEAAYALFRGGAKSRASDVMAHLVDETDTAVRHACLYMLARLGIAEAADVYIDFLADSDPFVRAIALRGLGQTEHPQAEHFLAIALNDDNQNVVAQAVASLSHMGGSNAAEKLAAKLPNAADEKIRVLIIESLTELEDAGGLSTVNRWLEASPTDNILIASIKYLAQIRRDRAVDMIDSVLNGEPMPRIRAACAEAYGIIDDRNVVPRLAVLFGDEDPMVRAAAFNVLVGLDAPNIDFYVNKALNDRDYVMVSLGVDQVGAKKLPSFLPTLRTLMSRGPEINVDVRRTCVSSAVPFLGTPQHDSAALEILIAGILDPNYVVRRDAAEIYESQLNENRWRQVPPADTRIRRHAIESAIDRYEVNPYAIITTNKGIIEAELYFDVAPLTVMNFVELAQDDFYEGLSFHRVIPGFVAQGGDPRGDGWGGPGYQIRDEYSWEPYKRGTMGIATSGKDTGGSQFFICYSPQPHLEGRYTVFGQVLAGMDVVDRLVIGDVIEKIEIKEGLQ